MRQQYAEVTLQRETAGWQLVDCSADFLDMTSFTREELRSRYHDHFLQLLSAVDMPAADELFEVADDRKPLCPWIFTLTCAEKCGTLPILLQLLPLEGEKDELRVRIHDATFLGEQTAKMGRRILSLENSIPSGLCQVLLDDNYKVIWYNGHYLDMIGYTEEQFINELGCCTSGYVHPEDFEAVTARLKEAMAQGNRVFQMEMRVVSRDGEVRCLMTSFSFTDETVNGVPVIYSMGIDITAQKRAQQLEMDAERLRMAMDQVSNYILEYDVLTHSLLASESLQKYFGIVGNAENVPESLIESGMVAAGSAEAIRKLFREIEQGLERAEEVVCLHTVLPDDGDLWFRLRMSSIYNDADHPVKAILLAEDITKHYQAEMRYKEEENRRVALTYDMDFSFTFDLTTEKILSANEPKFPFFNFKSSACSKELIRKNAASYVHPDDRAEYIKKLSTEHMLLQIEQGVPELNLEFRGRDTDGIYRWRRGVAHIIREPIEGHLCAYIYSKDIEDEKKKELELRRHAEQDALTGLYNRYTFEVYCDGLLGQQSADGLSVMYMLDLDNFKYLNDTYGHVRGDEMLRQTAHCLKEIFGERALLGRLGGDELVAFQSDCASEEEAVKTAQMVCDKIRGLEAGEGVVSASVGLAFSPRDGRAFADLYHYSDDALYQAKRAGKNQWAVYAKEGHETIEQKERLPVSREWLLEESSDIVYVCDFFSYDLLYMNLGARKMFGIENEEYRGRKCYEVLQQKAQPCEFCTNHLLCRDRFHSWEFRNRFLNKTLLLRDRIVDWYGTPARIEFATDISGVDQRNQALEEQVAIDKVIISCLRALNSANHLKIGIKAVLEEIAAFYGAERTFILDYSSQKNLLKPRFCWNQQGMRTSYQLIGEGVAPDESVLECFRKHENLLFDRTARPQDTTPHYHQALYDAGVTCQRAAPFYVSGQPAGLIGVDNPTAYRNETTVLETLSYFISEELTRSRLSESLEFLGYHDSLTGLWNRNHYVRYLEGLQAREIHTLGVAVADLNALKDINKLKGNSQGDTVVKRMADLLRESFPDAVLFRLSGDEFVVHCEDQERLAFLAQVQKVRDGSADLHAHGVSVGYAWTDREIDFSKLTMQATDIMLMQKQEYYQHEKEFRLSGKTDHANLQQLLTNIREGHFKMYLQPKADCTGFHLNGAEALVRFETPETGLIFPDRFVPNLEREHTIQYVDMFIFESVCQLLARWQREGRPLLIISLNFSRQTVLEPGLLKNLLATSERYHVPKDCIEVEITESLGDYESSTIAEIGAGIKSAGFRLALDDFGSHYTNMAMLSQVPVDVLKLDRGLVQHVMSSHPNQLVLKSILQLCKELGISSIAEGVETQEQLQLLNSLRCDSIQGYLFGRPTTVQDFETKYL